MVVGQIFVHEPRIFDFEIFAAADIGVWLSASSGCVELSSSAPAQQYREEVYRPERLPSSRTRPRYST